MTSLLVAPNTASTYEWDLVSPAGKGSDPFVLRELSEFRGRILYAGGRRPRFRRAGGGYADDDRLDSRSFHVTARMSGDLVGYLRLRPIPEDSQSFLERLATRPQLEAALKEMRLTPNDCLEVSRWIVAPCARGTAVASTLVVSAHAVGRWLGKRRLLATVGLRDGQVSMLARFGGQVIHSVDAKFLEEYDDDVALMHFDLDSPPPRVAEKLDEAGRLLNLCVSV